MLPECKSVNLKSTNLKSLQGVENMNSGFKTQCVPDYRLLTEDQIKEIHRASLEILETVGVRVSHEEGVQLLREAGCQVKENNVVRIPNWLVEECIRSAPSRITIYKGV